VARNDPLPDAVVDSGPVIHLDEIDCLDLLGGFRDVLVPDAVRIEVERHRPGAVSRAGPTVRLADVEVSVDPAFQSLTQALALAAGEQAAISLMMSRPAAFLLTDDAAARVAATSLGFRVHGTIGVLLRSLRLGQRGVEDVLSVLRALPARSTLHLRPQLLADIIRQVEVWRPGGSP
jgi:predicted nucleic acid-binding protein